jgi:hypothetical protein
MQYIYVKCRLVSLVRIAVGPLLVLQFALYRSKITEYSNLPSHDF